uniref:telomere repeat-binding protein 5 n=1 Tax=Erigeron canadensis TaxID=72917 RepID=UPI001CB9D309|nr:telomere repeat-binding protein 5 [Erigeron canadensis]XP_043620471.1 telomere repeat-binding protein 5 [Erigeron canadensis]XP_043620472.1 telomere repeat-binding protein 5 [Erigeron canadensis]
MVLQKRLEYGFYGYQVPPVPRAPRSARKRVSSVKKNEVQNRMCAFDLLATVAGKLLLEGNDSANKIILEETKVVTESAVKIEDDSLKAHVYDQDSCNKSFFVSEIIKGPITDTYSGPASGITVSDCKVQDINNKLITNGTPNNGKPPLVDKVDCNLNLVIRDDDENSCGYTHKTFRPPPRIGDRRIRRLSASKHWKAIPNTDVYRNKKSFYNYQRSLRDYPFKKRRMYRLDDHNLFNSNGNSGSVEDGSILDTANHDSHVKLKIKSFRVPEFFIEIPETATVSSLKRTVMEAVTAIFSGEVHVGVMLQGKRIRDDNKTLLQTGICHDNQLDALGFTLEPNEEQLPPFICPQDRSVVSPPATPKPLARYPPPQTIANQLAIQQKVPDSLPDFPITTSRNIMESDHDMSVDSRALVTVPAMNTNALTVLPMKKSKRVVMGQRRIRRPFSVSEVEALVEAVERLGTGRWRDVKLRAFDDAKHRTYVDLKDKWKTLVHTARISPQQRRGEPVPQELLDRVLTAHGYWSHYQAKNQFKHQLQTEICRLF